MGKNDYAQTNCMDGFDLGFLLKNKLLKNQSSPYNLSDDDFLHRRLPTRKFFIFRSLGFQCSKIGEAFMMSSWMAAEQVLLSCLNKT